MQNHDLEKCKRIAHTLKGSARAVGIRSAERAALQLERYYRQLLDSHTKTQDNPDVAMWLSRIRYWSEESHAKALFSVQPAALLWSRDSNQAAVYAALLGRQGYQVCIASTPDSLGQAMDSHFPPALLCIIEQDTNTLEKALENIAAHDHWAHAPALIFSSLSDIPPQIEAFCPSEKVAPGVLVAGLETIRESTT